MNLTQLICNIQVLKFKPQTKLKQRLHIYSQILINKILILTTRIELTSCKGFETTYTYITNKRHRLLTIFIYFLTKKDAK